MSPPITRREFITRLAQFGGSAYGAMLALGLLETPPLQKFSLAGQVEGKRIIILGAAAVALGNLSPAEREKAALAEGRNIHPQYDEAFETSFSVAWHKIKYNLGGWALYDQITRADSYPVLNEPDGAVYLAGEHLSYLTGWMAGALESAQQVVAALHARILSQ